MEASPEQLAEYEKQLADVEELLKASPEDESLLSLKSGTYVKEWKKERV